MVKEIVFISAPFCPKCVRVKRWLKELEESQSDITIKRYNMAFDFRKVREKYTIKTIPTLIVGEVMVGGWINEEEYREALKNLEKNP